MQPTIVIAENHEGLREWLRRRLEEAYPGCRVLETDNGEEAVRVAYVRVISLVIAAFHLPGLNGLQVAQCLKAVRPKLPVVILIPWEDEMYALAAATAGAGACVAKGKMDADLLPALENIWLNESVEPNPACQCQGRSREEAEFVNFPDKKNQSPLTDKGGGLV